MAKQHYMLEFLSDKPEIDVQYDNPQIYINEVLMVGDLLSFHAQGDFRKDVLRDYGTYLFKITEREFWVVDEDFVEEPETSCILLTIVPYYKNNN